MIVEVMTSALQRILGEKGWFHGILPGILRRMQILCPLLMRKE